MVYLPMSYVYGRRVTAAHTPLTDALRTLSAEMRQEALTKFEESAARLPTMLTLPMVIFILPCVFLIAGGPAIIQVIRAMG